MLKLVSLIKMILLYIMSKIAKLINKNFYYENRYGFKSIYGKNSINGEIKPIGDIIIVDPHDFYLGFDSLNDKYTSVGKKCEESLHYQLIIDMENKKIEKSNYIIAERKGCLDGRDSYFATQKKHYIAHNRAKKEMANDSYKPVKFYVIDGKKYLYDGKHRAALFAYFGNNIRAVEVPVEKMIGEKMKKLYKINKLTGSYNKHHIFFKLIREE